MEFTIPKHVPIKVKLKKEKEKAIKDLRNEKWHQDFQLEVTNISDKPMYFLSIWLVLPELVNPSGRPDGFSFTFGRMDFVDFDMRPVVAAVVNGRLSKTLGLREMTVASVPTLTTMIATAPQTRRSQRVSGVVGLLLSSM